MLLLFEPLIDDDTSISWQTTTDTLRTNSPELNSLCKLNEPEVKFVRSKSWSEEKLFGRFIEKYSQGTNCTVFLLFEVEFVIL